MVDPRGVELEQVARIIEPFWFSEASFDINVRHARIGGQDAANKKAAQIAALYADTITSLRGELEEAKASRNYWIDCHADVNEMAEQASAIAVTLQAQLTESQAQVVTLREALEDTTAHLVAATSLLAKSPKIAAPSDAMFDMMLGDYEASIARGREALALVGGEGQDSSASVAQSGGTASPKSEKGAGH